MNVSKWNLKSVLYLKIKHWLHTVNRKRKNYKIIIMDGLLKLLHLKAWNFLKNRQCLMYALSTWHRDVIYVHNMYSTYAGSDKPISWKYIIRTGTLTFATAAAVKRHAYKAQFKLQVISYAVANGKRAAALGELRYHMWMDSMPGLISALTCLRFHQRWTLTMREPGMIMMILWVYCKL